jgi:acetate kinase
MVAALGGLDALVFTGGIGENSAAIRERVCKLGSWLGIELDRDATHEGKSRISAANSGVSVWIISTNEELMIARHAQNVLRLSNSARASHAQHEQPT